MSSLKLYECTVGVDIDGVNYEFSHVRSVTLENPERNNLMRGVNAPNSAGISFKEGMMEPKTITVPVIEMSTELFNLLTDCYTTQKKINFYAIDKQGQSFLGKQSVLAQAPMQLTLDESPESMDCTLEFVTFLVEQKRI